MHLSRVSLSSSISLVANLWSLMQSIIAIMQSQISSSRKSNHRIRMFQLTSYFLPSPSLSLDDAKISSFFSPIEHSSIATCRSPALPVKSDAVRKRSNLCFQAIYLDVVVPSWLACLAPPFQIWEK